MKDEIEKLICQRFRSFLERLSEQFVNSSSFSYHGVRKIKIDQLRCCMSNHYFSPTSLTGQDYFSASLFSAGSEQKLLYALAPADNKLRHIVHRVIPSGAGKKNIYKGLAQ